MTREDPEKSGYIKDDHFLVQCAITVLLGAQPRAELPEAPPPARFVAAPSSDLHTHFGELLRSQKGADITFLVAGEPVAAHRCVLAARSPVLMAELYGGMREKDAQRVEIKDMEVAVFRALLHFIYTDTLPELDQLGEEQAAPMVQHLLSTADWYGLERLKAICEEKLCGAISVETAASSLALAEQHGCSKLRARCMEFVVAAPKNLDAIAATESYKNLMASCPSVMTDLLKLMVKRQK